MLIKREYLHSEMIDEAQPAARMFEEDVKPFLEGLSLFMMEHIFRLEGLVDGKINRIIGIGNANLIRTRWLFLLSIVVNIVLVSSSTMLPPHWCWHTFMMRLAKSRRTKSTQESKFPRGFIHWCSIIGILSFTAGCFQCQILRFASDELVFAALKGSVGGRGAVPLLCQPSALVLALWKTVVVSATFEFQDSNMKKFILLWERDEITFPLPKSFLKAEKFIRRFIIEQEY